MVTFRFSPRPNRASQIQWREWSSRAFLEAKLGNKPVLLSLSASWDQWCHVMDETSYSDQEVISFINQSYIPIRVDTDRRPDVNIRYNMGGWPSTVILTPDGDVLAGATFLDPQRFKELLSQTSGYFHQEGLGIQMRMAEERSRQEAMLAQQVASPEIPDLLTEEVVQLVATSFDAVYGGFGFGAKFPVAEPIELLLLWSQVTGNMAYLLMAARTLDQIHSRAVYDQDEGGLFRFTTTREWDSPHYEKLLEVNASILRSYLRVFRATREQSYRETAQGIMAYLQATLWDRERGAFYGSQAADESYYRLGKDERRNASPPLVDKTFYTYSNALAASAFLEASWVINRSEATDIAIRALDFLWENCWSEDEGIYHCWEEGERYTEGLLIDHVAVARAFLDAYEVTGQSKYLRRAQALADLVQAHYQDPIGGGFYDIREQDTAVGNLRYRDKVLLDNCLAAEVFTYLFRFTGTDGYREAAHSALAVFARDYRAYGIHAAAYGLACYHYREEPLHVVIVGGEGSPETWRLVASALSLSHSFRIVQVVDPDEDPELLEEMGYPPSEKPVAYLCYNMTCSAPLEDPEQLEKAAQAMLNPLVHNL